MPLQFILGGSGSGKTRLLYENLIRMSMEAPDCPHIAIVPEQFTMQTQKEIVALHPRHGVMNIDIVSFQRLAYRVFEELAVENPAVLDDMGKSMALRKVAGDRKRELAVFGGHLNQNGFIGQLKSMVSELLQYGVGPDTLDELARESEKALLKRKLQDLSAVYKGFEEYMSGRFITTEQILDVLCGVLPESELIKRSVVTLDGYTGFTPVQYRILELLLKYGKKVMVSVTIDPRAVSYRMGQPQELFFMSRKTLRKLTDLAASNGAEIEEAIVLNQHPAVRYAREDGESLPLGSAGYGGGEEAPGNPLDFLEQNIFRYSGRAFAGAQSQVRVFKYMNPSSETAGIAGQILSLVESGMRYRDMAVITGSLDTYAREIVRRFEAEGIPYFLDNKKSILDNPMVELIRAALEVVQKDFSYESVFRCLKTGLLTENEEELNRLENYVRALGIRGFKRWDSRWEAVYRGGRDLNLEELNALREEVLKPFKPLREAFSSKEATVRSMTEAVAGFLAECRAEEKLKEREKIFDGAGEYSLAKEYGQVYPLAVDLLDRIVKLLGDEKVGRKEYAEILDAGFGEIRVGLIPATVDRVVVGDLTRTRLDHIKVLFFAGVNDGVIPPRREGGNLLSDSDRKFFAEHEVELAPDSREEGFMQRFYLYLMMTKPALGLRISYPAMDASGKGLRPSGLIGEVRKLFPALTVEDGEKKTGIHSLKEARDCLVSGLRAYGERGGDAEFLELYRWFFRSGNYGEELKRLVEAAFYSSSRRGIGRAAARELYGTVLSGSVTRLEKYASCAYAHFLTYGLGLQERQIYKLAAADIGTLFHDSIDLCFRMMKERGGDWRTLSGAERKALVAYCVERVSGEYGNTILQSSARNAYLAGRLERITDRTVWALAEQLKRGDFSPEGFELSFSERDHLNAMNIRLSGTESLQLSGRVDRLDLCEDGDRLYVKIIDYKSGGTSFDLTSLCHGLQLQLAVYMDAVMELEAGRHPDKRVIPAGIFYYNIDDPVIEKQGDMGPEEIERQILKQLKMNGLVNSSLDVIRHLDREIETESDVIPVAMKNGLIQEARSSVAGGKRFEALRGYVKEKLRAQGQRILSGDAAVNPYKQGNRTACDYCPYHAVCGFDLKTKGCGYRRLKSMKPDEAWQEIEGGKSERGGGENGD